MVVVASLKVRGPESGVKSTTVRSSIRCKEGRKLEHGFCRAAHHKHTGRGVCVSDGDRALLPDRCRGVAGEGQWLAYCCLVAAAAHVNSANGDHRSGCATVGD